MSSEAFKGFRKTLTGSIVLKPCDFFVSIFVDELFRIMPCPCNLPMELYPEASEWGPLLWTLLHGLAQKSGKGPFPMYAEDERRAWVQIFKLTADIIPCHICKEHFRLYLEEHPVDELKNLQLGALNDWITSWFWEVHEWVNMTLEKPSFPKEELENYNTVNLRAVLNALDAPMRRAITLSGNQFKKYSEWKSKYLMIMSILGL